MVIMIVCVDILIFLVRLVPLTEDILYFPLMWSHWREREVEVSTTQTLLVSIWKSVNAWSDNLTKLQLKKLNKIKY